eukprot:CAMPEP_0117431010 /NCGR_PEP_ID=MMETSP0758-20121206/10567_1 /TAXON_ID=63605 /ORGANISM="Percolomonas cosmopolitus, Strain AE-1 (ATCC 50343)" /LENGTH=79 /DNA_ID=CAMNT_0005219637 /DNA_START=127 /DNA_END=366 /DNA_ORIENTATION=+
MGFFLKLIVWERFLDRLVTRKEFASIGGAEGGGIEKGVVGSDRRELVDVGVDAVEEIGVVSPSDKGVIGGGASTAGEGG